ncbi:transglutaminaseTgpA domain-containing protein [Streptomyces sp. NPDC014733]|uniref:transglutaminase family protein n=1 Tax=Streptomyces sp. NPDC014733 TaxID=3364885 RepID=UPI0036FDBD60
MSGRGPALWAAVATLCASCALVPLVDPVSWMVPAALLVVLVTAAGAGARRLPWPRPVVVVAQAVVAASTLTALYAGEQALLGVVPGPDAVAELVRLGQSGVADVSRYASPAPLTPGIRLLLVGGVTLVGLAVDALAVTYRSAAPAGLPLLALYSVAAGLTTGGTGWLWFLIAAAGYLLLLLAEGRDRLSRWGRVFGGTAGRGSRWWPRPGKAASGPAPVRHGRRIGALALGVAVAVPAALPSLGTGLLGTGGPDAGSGGGTISAVNPLVSLQNSLNQPEDKEVLNYRTTAGDTRDLYLRIVALDQFDGTAWKPSERTVTDVPEQLPRPAGLSPEVATTQVNTSISTAEWYGQNWLPMPFPASRVGIAGRWRFEEQGRTLVGDRGQNTRGLQYQVESLRVRPTARQLAEAPPPPDALRREYTRVPAELPPVVAATARQVTRGAATPYAKAVKLQDWFATDGGFRYDTEVRAGSGVKAIARFLEQKEGFCVHFSFSMAAMARTLGIPARVAVGFTPGTKQPDGTTSVGLRDAHAWPELYFEGVGWTRFEPTPSRGNIPEYALPDTSRDHTSGSPAQEPTRPTMPTGGPRPDPTCGPGQRAGATGCTAAAPTAPAPGSPGGGPSVPAVVGLILGGLLLLSVAALPALWRRRLRDRRLSGEGPAAALDAWQELTDTAWDLGVAPDEALTPRRTAVRLAEAAALPPEAAEAVHRVAGAVEESLYAARPRPAPQVTADVRVACAALYAQASRGARWRAALAPRSADRQVRAYAARWTAFRRRRAAGRTATAVRRLTTALRPGGRRT